MTKDTLYEVSDMIHELGVALPPLKFYKSMPSFDPIDPEIGDSLVEIHTELVCFYARVIHFFKRNKHRKSSTLIPILVHILKLEK